jgi:chemotaxis protein methyltransferase WspC
MAMAMLDASLPPGCFRVEAVDISTRALAQAARAVYGKNSFRGQDLSFRDRYFDTTLAGYRLHDAVRRQVHFQSGNLFAPDFLPGAEIYDVIFCRNVLIYFDRETQDRAIGVLQRLLKAKGTLFVAPAETGLTSSHDFVSTNLPLAFAFRRAPPRAAHAPIAAPLQPASLPRPVPSRPAASQASRPTAVPRLLPQTVVQKTPPSDDLDVALQLANQGHFVEAATHCEAHLRQHGPSATAFCLMGLVRDATGNHLDAGKYYRKALYLDPDNGETQIHLALLMEKQGDTAGAQVLRNRAKRLEHKRKISHE